MKQNYIYGLKKTSSATKDRLEKGQWFTGICLHTGLNTLEQVGKRKQIARFNNCAIIISGFVSL